MKIVVIGGTGLIGSKLVKKLSGYGHEAVAAAPSSGVNSITGEGLAEALKGASVVVDVTNAPSWEDLAVLRFFETSTRNLLANSAAAAVGHYIALSVVGTERLLESGYFRAKLAQENLIKASSLPYTIVRATQFFEFLKQIADYSTEGNKVRLPPARIQPMAADDVASALAGVSKPSCEWNHRNRGTGTVSSGRTRPVGPGSVSGSPRSDLRPAGAVLRHPGEREVAGS